MTIENCKVNDCHKRELLYEIERLRAALEQAVSDFGDSHCVCEDTKQMCIAALSSGQRETDNG